MWIELDSLSKIEWSYTLVGSRSCGKSLTRSATGVLFQFSGKNEKRLLCPFHRTTLDNEFSW